MTGKKIMDTTKEERKFSDILWEAANEKLWDGEGYGWRIREYSCEAVWRIVGSDPILDFLEELGVQTNSIFQMEEFSYGPERQAVRYCWLMFASMIAEEWGL